MTICNECQEWAKDTALNTFKGVGTKRSCCWCRAKNTPSPTPSFEAPFPPFPAHVSVRISAQKHPKNHRNSLMHRAEPDAPPAGAPGTPSQGVPLPDPAVLRDQNDSSTDGSSANGSASAGSSLPPAKAGSVSCHRRLLRRWRLAAVLLLVAAAVVGTVVLYNVVSGTEHEHAEQSFFSVRCPAISFPFPVLCLLCMS